MKEFIESLVKDCEAKINKLNYFKGKEGQYATIAFEGGLSNEQVIYLISNLRKEFGYKNVELVTFSFIRVRKLREKTDEEKEREIQDILRKYEEYQKSKN